MIDSSEPVWAVYSMHIRDDQKHLVALFLDHEDAVHFTRHGFVDDDWVYSIEEVE